MTVKEIVIGQKIKSIRFLNDKEMKERGWYSERSAVLILENGVELFAATDYEGNDSGALFGKKGRLEFIVFPESKN